MIAFLYHGTLPWNLPDPNLTLDRIAALKEKTTAALFADFPGESDSAPVGEIPIADPRQKCERTCS